VARGGRRAVCLFLLGGVVGDVSFFWVRDPCLCVIQSTEWVSDLGFNCWSQSY
jgi:hypothetical protein